MSRQQENLNLDWKFLKGDDKRAWYKGFDDSHFENVTLPHDWSVKYPFSKDYSSGTGYLAGGKGWYRKKFNLDITKEQRVYITFDGVYNNSQVWCNSTLVGTRPYGYSAFTYDITDFVLRNDENCISVKVNHDDIADSRWFTGSGIYRDVTLTITEDVVIDQYGVFVTTKEVTGSSAVAIVQTNVSNYSTSEKAVTIKNIVSFGDEQVSISKSTITLPVGQIKSEIEIKIDDVKLWDVCTADKKVANMYKLTTQIISDETIVDEVDTSFGIRTFGFCADTGFYLNGQNMKIKGVCVHHDAGCLGAAVPPQVWVRRLEKLRDMGCNAIRTAHNPPASYLLDLCDEMGFLVMDEAFDEWEGPKNKWWQGHNVYPPKTDGYYEHFIDWGERDVKDMVLRDRNHPSIIMWSVGNEIDYPNDPYCHPLFEEMTGNNDANKPVSERQYDPDRPNADRLAVIASTLAKYVKEVDTTRPVTAALAFPELSNLVGYAQAIDVVGYNYKEHLYEDDHKKYPKHVIYGSENGAGIDQWNAVKDNDYICGQFIWTGIDYMGEAHGWPIRVAQPGFLDVAGNEKPKYYYRKSLWTNEDVLHIGTTTIENHWQDHATWNYSDDDKVFVHCYTSCEKVELFLNDVSLGEKNLCDYEKCFIPFEVNYSAGTLKAVGTTKSGKKMEFVLTTDGVPSKLDVTVDKDTLSADYQDICHIEIGLIDDNGNVMNGADNWISIGVSAGIELLGLENGDASDLTSFTSTKRRLHYGKLIVYVRAKNIKGNEMVTISTDTGIVADVKVILK